MAIVHIVRAGESLVAIAQVYGFRAWETIAEAPENKELFAKRHTPHALEPGDELHIPEPQRGARSFATGKSHIAVVRTGAPLLELRVYTEFRRVPDGVAAGDKTGTIRGWIRGKTVPPLPVTRAKISVGTSEGLTSKTGLLRVAALADGLWTLHMDPQPDELSPGPALPDPFRDHGLAWGQGNVPRTAEGRIGRHYEVEYRPLDLEIQVVNGAIVSVVVTNPKRDDRPHHAVCFWGAGVPSGGVGVTQVLEIDLKPDFLRKLYDGFVRPVTQIRKPQPVPDGDDETRPLSEELFMLHHTGGNLISGALQQFFGKSNKSGIHYLNDRDGHVVRLADDRYHLRHGGGKARVKPAWADRADINHRAIGVENVQGRRAKGDKVQEPFTDAQIASVIGLIRAAQGLYGIPKWKTVGHGDCYLGKAGDCPGSMFPWKRLEDEGLTIRPLELDEATREMMFGGYFAGPHGKKRVLKVGDVDAQGADGRWSVRRGSKTLAEGLLAPPIKTLHELLHALGYVPNRLGDGAVQKWDPFKESSACKQFGRDTEAALRSFKGHYGSIDRPELGSHARVDFAAAVVITGCALDVGVPGALGSLDEGMILREPARADVV